VDFDVHSLNLFVAENLVLPEGVRLLPNTRAMFVQTDASAGSYEAELFWFFNPENLDTLLANFSDQILTR